MRQSRITGREKQILELSAAGLSSRQVADKLSISVHTVESFCGIIRRKLGVVSTKEAVKKAAEEQLISAVMLLQGGSAAG